VDVNGDHALDLVIANNRGGPGDCEQVSRTLRIMINKGHGTFRPDYGVDVAPLQEMAVGADVNGDGITDLVSTSAISSVVIGTGGGHFAPPVTNLNRGNEILSADFNGDGDADIATSDGSQSDVYVWLNNGDGTFTTKKYAGEKTPGYLTGNAIAAGDLNGDRRVDLVVSDAQGQDAGVFYGLAHGAFASEVRYGVQYEFTDVNVADYDGDGHPDIGGPAGRGGLLSPTVGVTTLINLTR
jgi:hypothetical protein